MSTFVVDGVDEEGLPVPLDRLLIEPAAINRYVDVLGDHLDSSDANKNTDGVVVELLTHLQKSTAVYFKSMANDLIAIKAIGQNVKRQVELIRNLKGDYVRRLNSSSIGVQLRHKAQLSVLAKRLIKSIPKNIYYVLAGDSQMTALSKALSSILTRQTCLIEITVEWTRILNRTANGGYKSNVELESDLTKLVRELEKRSMSYGSEKLLSDSHKVRVLKSICTVLSEISTPSGHLAELDFNPWNVLDGGMFEYQQGADLASWSDRFRMLSCDVLNVNTCKFVIDDSLYELFLDACCLMSDKLLAMALESKAFYMLAEQMGDAIATKYTLLSAEYKDLMSESVPTSLDEFLEN